MSLRSKAAQLTTSPWLREKKRQKAEKKRQRNKQPHRVVVYLRLNDAYSYLLLQVLSKLAQRYPIEYEFRTILELQHQMYPAPLLWEKNAFTDGVLLAQMYQLEFPQQQPDSNPQRDRELSAQLLHWELQPNYLEKALALFNAYWSNNQKIINNLVNSDICRQTECYQHHLQANQDLLKNQGHYLSAMLHYGGEWYWGLDRLEHLERRFNTLLSASCGKNTALNGDKKTVANTVEFNLSHKNFCRTAADTIPAATNVTETEPLLMYWSARSPYSYIGLVRAQQLCHHYKIPLILKPVLPMVMRRMQVPKTKGRYILFDTKREADKHNIPFGNIEDPLGKGVERCYALFEYAAANGKAVELALSFARAVWAEGVASETKLGMEYIVSRAGLHWTEAEPLLDDNQWRNWAQDNLAEMYSKDLWGVPSFSYQSLRLFGQDRLEALEQAFIATTNNANSRSNHASN